MAILSKLRRLVNPGRKKRKMSPKQIAIFGTKRQKAALKLRKRNAGRNSLRKTTKAAQMSAIKRHTSKYGKRVARYIAKGAVKGTKARYKRNVGSIITVWPNPGKKSMSRRARKKRMKSWLSPSGVKTLFGKNAKPRKNKGETKMAIRRKRVARRRKNYGTRVGRSWSTFTSKKRRKNPGRRRRVSVMRKRYSRRRNPGIRRRSYRRNPGMLTGTAGRVLGVVGGVAVTKLLCGFLPTSLSVGLLGYLATAGVAVLQGKMVGKFSKSAALGNDMVIGGLAYLTAKVLNDFFPQIGAYTGISGMGLIGGSSFYTPQVNMAGNMGAFQVPAATRGYVAGAMPAPVAKGVGTLRRTGRLM